jgi:hypothetical protein
MAIIDRPTSHALQHPAHPDPADPQVTGKISLACETSVSEHPGVSLLECFVVNPFFGPGLQWPEPYQSCLRKTPDGFLVEPQLLRQTLAVHANEPLPVPQIVGFDRDFEEDKVRVSKPLAEPMIPDVRTRFVIRYFSISSYLRRPGPFHHSGLKRTRGISHPALPLTTENNL